MPTDKLVGGSKTTVCLFMIHVMMGGVQQSAFLRRKERDLRESQKK